MFSVVQTPGFSAWLHAVEDPLVRARLLKRLRRASQGNLGDTQFVGEGVFEMREHFGAGWRMYYTQRAGSLIFMLAGGTKSSQKRDIAKAIALAKEI